MSKSIHRTPHQYNVSTIISLNSFIHLSFYSGYYSSKTKKPTLTKSQSCLSDFDARYLGALDDFDELEEIEPGSLTINGTGKF